MIDDATLLRRYAEQHSEEAFAELVRRYIDLVYAVARRRVGASSGAAEDVTQRVFTDLARKAGVISTPSLAGWLHVSTRHEAMDYLRAESRRRAREQKAYVMREQLRSTDLVIDGEKLRPVLDDVIGELNAADREAVLLRFYQGRTFVEIGTALRASEDSARKRVERALEKLRAQLVRRGVPSTAAALSVALAEGVAGAAPAGLASAVAGAAFASSAVSSGGAILFLLMHSTKTMVAATAITLASLSTAVWEVRKVQAIERASGAAAQAQVTSQRKTDELENQLEHERQARAAAQAEAEKLRAALATLESEKKTERPGPLTHDEVQARYRHADELAKNGQFEEALKEYLWCFDDGMLRANGFGGVRSSFLVASVAKLGEQYPPALVALRERRDAAERQFKNNGDSGAAMDFASLNQALGDDQRTLAMFDQLPSDDARRKSLGFRVVNLLVEAQRYAEAATLVPYSAMTARFENALSTLDMPLPASVKNPERLKQAKHDYVVNTTAENIEILAGAGDLEAARTLAAKVMGFDNSDAVRATLQEHLVRAGHPEIMAQLPK